MPSASFSLRVVVVEDHPKMVNLYQRALERQACTVVTFASAEDAMPATRKRFPNVAFVDIDLQAAMSGLDLRRILSKKASVRPFVVMANGLAELDTLRCAAEYWVHMLFREPLAWTRSQSQLARLGKLVHPTSSN